MRNSSSLVFLAIVAAYIGATNEQQPDPYSGCHEFIANNGYGYRKVFPLNEIAQSVGQHFELEFYVQSKQVLQILLTSVSNWPGLVGTPYEIQNYNNEVFMFNRRNRMVTRVNRNHILDERIPVPMVLRVFPQNNTFDLQVDGERQPFIRFVDSRPIAGVSHIAFGTHGPNDVRYLYGCSKKTAAITKPPCEDFFHVRTDNKSVTIALADLRQSSEVEVRTANETVHMEFTAERADNQSTVRLVLHARDNFETVGSPYYEIELGEIYTMRRRGLLVATRLPNVDLFKNGQQVVVNVAVKEDGQVQVWLNSQRSQKLRFRDDFPIDMRYVTFKQGLWTYNQCT